MTRTLAHLFAAASCAPLLAGCMALRSGSLEVLNPAQAYGQSLAVAADVHRENEAIEGRLAADLKSALAKHGLTVVDDTKKADLVIIPTLGRMKERSASEPIPTEPVMTEESTPVEPVAEPVVAARTTEPRLFTRLSSGDSILTRTSITGHRPVPSARVPASAQQAGLLLTAYRAKDYEDYGIGRQSLPPVWRIFVSQPAAQMKWKTVAMPLVNAAAKAAAPLGKSTAAQSEEPKVKRSTPAEEQPELQVAGSESRERKTKEEPKKRKLFGLFGSSADQDAKKQEAEQPKAGN